MTPVQKLAGLVLAVALLLVLGGVGGVWLAARHYRPLLDTANKDLASAKSAQDSLEAMGGEQGRKIEELVQAGSDRELAATMAQDRAVQDAQSDYSVANQLLLERTGGDPANAAAAIIDKELGL